MSLLRKENKSKSVQLAEQSEVVIGGFLKFSNDLSKINSDIDAEDKALELQVNTIAIQRASLSDTRQRNQKFIDKIDKFINED